MDEIEVALLAFVWLFAREPQHLPGTHKRNPVPAFVYVTRVKIAGFFVWHRWCCSAIHTRRPSEPRSRSVTLTHSLTGSRVRARSAASQGRSITSSSMIFALPLFIAWYTGHAARVRAIFYELQSQFPQLKELSEHLSCVYLCVRFFLSELWFRE